MLIYKKIILIFQLCLIVVTGQFPIELDDEVRVLKNFNLNGNNYLAVAEEEKIIFLDENGNSKGKIEFDEDINEIVFDEDGFMYVAGDELGDETELARKYRLFIDQEDNDGEIKGELSADFQGKSSGNLESIAVGEDYVYTLKEEGWVRRFYKNGTRIKAKHGFWNGDGVDCNGGSKEMIYHQEKIFASYECNGNTYKVVSFDKDLKDILGEYEIKGRINQFLAHGNLLMVASDAGLDLLKTDDGNMASLWKWKENNGKAKSLAFDSIQSRFFALGTRNGEDIIVKSPLAENGADWDKWETVITSDAEHMTIINEYLYYSQDEEINKRKIFCSVGEELVDGNCQQCQQGSFKLSLGNRACTEFPNIQLSISSVDIAQHLWKQGEVITLSVGGIQEFAGEIDSIKNALFVLGFGHESGGQTLVDWDALLSLSASIFDINDQESEHVSQNTRLKFDGSTGLPVGVMIELPRTVVYEGLQSELRVELSYEISNDLLQKVNSPPAKGTIKSPEFNIEGVSGLSPESWHTGSIQPPYEPGNGFSIKIAQEHMPHVSQVFLGTEFECENITLNKDKIYCDLPSGITGKDLPVRVLRGGFLSNRNTNISIKSPNIERVEPNTLVYSYGSQITIKGNYFGHNKSNVQVWFIYGDIRHEAIISNLDNSSGDLNVNFPEEFSGLEAPLEIEVVVNGQKSTNLKTIRPQLEIAMAGSQKLKEFYACEAREVVNLHVLGLLPVGLDEIEVRVEFEGVDYSFTVSDVVQLNQTHIQFQLPLSPGPISAKLTPVVAGNPSSNSTTVNFGPAKLDEISDFFSSSFSTRGSDLMLLTGYNFGASIHEDGYKINFNLFQVKIGDNLCADVINTANNGIICFTPAGSGEKLDVKLIGPNSMELILVESFSYAKPKISGVYPEQSQWTQGSEIEIMGENFGVDLNELRVELIKNSDKTTDVLQCSNLNITSNLDVVKCALPASFVSSETYSLRVEVSSQVSEQTKNPTIFEVYPENGLSTTGGDIINLVGSDIQSVDEVLIDAHPCTSLKLLYDETTLQCESPPFIGKDLDIKVRGNGLEVIYKSSFKISYQPPKILDLSPSRFDGNPNLVFSIIGENFGPSENVRSPIVRFYLAPEDGSLPDSQTWLEKNCSWISQTELKASRHEDMTEDVYFVTVVIGGQESVLNSSMTFDNSATNPPPIAVDASSTLNQDTRLRLQLDASDPLGESLSVFRITKLPNNGKLFQFSSETQQQAGEITSDMVNLQQREFGWLSSGGGKLFYRPNQYYNGRDEFEYMVKDDVGLESNTAKFELTISKVNVAPSFTKESVGVLINDIQMDPESANEKLSGEWVLPLEDVEGDEMVVYAVENNVPSRGKWLAKINDPSKSVKYQVTVDWSKGLVIPSGLSVQVTLQYQHDSMGGGYPFDEFILEARDSQQALSTNRLLVRVTVKCPVSLVNNVWWALMKQVERDYREIYSGQSVALSSGSTIDAALAGLSDSLCSKCPQGADCTQSGEKLPTNLLGYYQAWPGFFIECTPREACPANMNIWHNYSSITDQQALSPDSPGAGLIGADGFSSYCATGYKGTRCGECEMGYYRASNQCFKCPSRQIQWAIVIPVVLIGSMLALGFGYWLMKRFDLGFLSIVVTFFQTLAIFQQFKLQWPDTVMEFFRVFSVFNLDLDLLAPECYFSSQNDSGDKSSGYELKFFITLALPLVLLCALLLAYVLIKFLLPKLLIYFGRIREKLNRGQKNERESSKASSGKFPGLKLFEKTPPAVIIKTHEYDILTKTKEISNEAVDLSSSSSSENQSSSLVYDLPPAPPELKVKFQHHRNHPFLIPDEVPANIDFDSNTRRKSVNGSQNSRRVSESGTSHHRTSVGAYNHSITSTPIEDESSFFEGPRGGLGALAAFDLSDDEDVSGTNGHKRKNAAELEHQTEKLLEKSQNEPTLMTSLLSVYILFMKFLYLSLVKRTFELYNCSLAVSAGDANAIEEQRLYYFEAQPSRMCYTEQWWYDLLPYSILSIIFYIVGFPVLVLFLSLQRMKILEPINSLFENDKNEIEKETEESSKDSYSKAHLGKNSDDVSHSQSSSIGTTNYSNSQVSSNPKENRSSALSYDDYYNSMNMKSLGTSAGGASSHDGKEGIFSIIWAKICLAFFAIFGIRTLRNYEARLLVLRLTNKKHREFRHDREYWDVVIMSRKLSIILGQLFFASFPGFQAVVLLLIIFFSYLAHRQWLPFRQPSLNRLESTAIVASILVLLSGLLFFNGVFYSQDLKGLDIVVLVLIGLALALIAWQLYGQFQRVFRQSRKLQEKTKHVEQNQEVDVQKSAEITSEET